MPATWQDVLKIGLALPGVEEGTSYGTPALKVAKKFLTRLRTEDGSIVVMMPMDEREIKMEAAPEIYHITDHYRSWPTVLVRLSNVPKKELAALLTRAWENAAPKKLLAAAAKHARG